MRIAALAAFAAIVVGGFQPFYLRILATDATPMRAAFSDLPYRKLPGFRRFLVDVDRSTPPGASIAIALPFGAWDRGYEYGYNRAGYLLPGKQPVPLLDLYSDRPAPRNLDHADWVAAWHAAPQIEGFVTVWRSADGTLLRRVH